MEAETSTETTDTGLSFAYDASGLRTEKTVVTKTYETVHTHDYTATVIEPTCTEGGYTLHECDCGDSYQDNETDPLGHDYEKISQDGYYTYYRCTRCDVRRREPLITIPVTPEPPLEQYGSSEEENQVAATPKSNGSERQLLSTVTEEHSYIYAGGMLLRETITSGNTTRTLDFRYDNVGYPYALIYNNGSTTATYYYITNLQGDVMYLVDSNGNQVAAYTYDPYGKILSAYGSMAEINPLRYRGYYYDAETGFYYLQSRYYDPNTCRFINADSYASTGQSYLGYNMFAYCGNNPVERTDADGEFWDIIFDVVSVVTSVVDVIQNPDDPLAWAGLVGDIVDVAVPFVTGVGETVKAVSIVANTADTISDVRKAAQTVDQVDSVVDAAKKVYRAADRTSDLKKATGAYEITYRSGKNYVGKGGFNRAINSAKRLEKIGNDEVVSISWKSAPSARDAFIDEYYMMCRRGINNANTYNKIWSPGRSYHIANVKKMFQ